MHVPKRHELRHSPPMSVYEATQAFGSELRVALIHYFAATPGRQADAAVDLGVDRAVVSLNVRTLQEIGLLQPTPSPTNPRSMTYSVDRDRFDELLAALRDYARPRRSSRGHSASGESPD